MCDNTTSEEDWEQPKDMYACLLTEDESERASAIDHIVTTLKDITTAALRGGNNKVLEFVATHGALILQYSKQCPFRDITEAFSELLTWLRGTCLLEIEAMLCDDSDSNSECSDDEQESNAKKNGFLVNDTTISKGNPDTRSDSSGHSHSSGKSLPSPCSQFIDVSELDPLLTTEPVIQKLFQASFISEGEVPNWIRIASLKPEVATKIHRTWTTMLSMGPLPETHRWYIAKMTATLCKSEYWITRTEIGLCRAGGLETNPKLQAFSAFNVKLATAPWQIVSADLNELAKSGWTVSEMVQGIIIAARMLGFCSFGKGSGVLLEGAKCRPGPRMCRPASTDDVTDMLSALNSTNLPECIAPGSTPVETFHKLVDDEDDYLGSDSLNGSEENLPQHHPNARNQPLGYFDIRFKGFRPRGEEKTSPFLRLADYNWKDDACCVVEQLSSGELAKQLDEVFGTVVTMTDNDIFGHVTNIDTSKLRRMVWFYVHNLYGIQADDMEYNNINSLVGIKKPGVIGLKRYIKFVGCETGDVTHTEYYFDNTYTQV